MPLNIPGLLVPFQLLIFPRLVIPSLVVKAHAILTVPTQSDIRQIDFPSLKGAGYRGVVFDKDNCLTLPHRDTLVPELREAWKSCRETFGKGNVLIVSNSAGTWLDAGGIQSESVMHHLHVPVLLHRTFKPGYSCIPPIRTYFSSLRSPIQDHELVIIGDRVFTDVVLANRMAMQSNHRKWFWDKSPPVTSEKDSTSISQQKIGDLAPNITGPSGPLSIWTTGVWERDNMFIRWLERGLVKTVERWSTPPSAEPVDISMFLKEVPPPEPSKKPGMLEKLSSRLTRA